MSDIRLAVVGDHNPGYETHRAIDHTLTLLPPGVEAAWHGTDQPLLGDLDAVCVAPGSPYRDDDAVYRTIEAARRGGTPILGTCGGCQYMLVEFARNVAGLDEAAHGEVDPDATEPLVASLACSLVGRRRKIRPVAGTRLAALTGDPFYLATLFQPQMESLATGVLHPILCALIAAARATRRNVPSI